MIYLNTEEVQKIALLDKLFQTLSVEDITQMVESDLIVGKLKGVSISGPGRLGQIFTEFVFLQGEATALRSEMITLKSDFQCLLRCLNKPMGDYSIANDFSTLKSRHNIY